eukprot:637802_1
MPGIEEDNYLVQDPVPINLNDPRGEPVAKVVGICYMCCFLVLLSPCIIALLLAIKYHDGTSSPLCKTNEVEYLVPLDLWLEIGAGVAVIVFVTYFIVNCYQTFYASLKAYTQISQLLVSKSHASSHCMLTTFHAVWAIVGIYMYTNQMPLPCQSSNIGIVILIFCIFQLSLTCCTSFCALMMILNIKDRRRRLGPVGDAFLFNTNSSTNYIINDASHSQETKTI